VLDLERNFRRSLTNHELIDISRIHPEAMQSNVQHLEALLERHVAESASVWAGEIVNDLRNLFCPKFWVVKPKAASIDSLVDSLRRAGLRVAPTHGRQEPAIPRHPALGSAPRRRSRRG